MVYIFSYDFIVLLHKTNEMDRHTDLDLDVYNACERIIDHEKESIFYMRLNDDRITINFTGDSVSLANGFIQILKDYPDLYEVLDSALSLYEESLDHGYSEN